MFENPRRGKQARNFTTNVPKILVLKSSSEQIFSRKLPLGAPDVVVQTKAWVVLIFHKRTAQVIYMKYSPALITLTRHT